MSTLLALNPAQLPPLVPEILAPEFLPVREYHDELQAAAKAYRISTMRIAFYGHRMRMTEGWTVLGYEPGPRGEEAYREDLGVPRSSWYRAVRIGQALHQLPLPELERIPVENAEIILAVNPTIMHDHNWVHEAKTKSRTELAGLVASRNRAIGDKREPLVTMLFRVPVAAKAAIETMLLSFMKRWELSSKSQTLELLVADRHDQANTLAAMNKARQLVAASLVLLKSKNKLHGTEAGEWLQLGVEVLDEAYEKAIQGSRQKAERVQKDGGRT